MKYFGIRLPSAEAAMHVGQMSARTPEEVRYSCEQYIVKNAAKYPNLLERLDGDILAAARMAFDVCMWTSGRACDGFVPDGVHENGPASVEEAFDAVEVFALFSMVDGRIRGL